MSATVRPPLLNVLCLPCAGASATMYLRWRRLLPEWIRVVPVELPGRGERLAEPLAEDFDALVAQLCHEQASLLSGHFALFGHSMGALLAYGMAQHLRAAGLSLPQALFVSGSPAPSRRDPGRFQGKEGDAALIADLRKQGGTPQAVFDNAELLRLTLDTLGADYRVCQSFTHRAAQPLPLPLHVFGGRDDDISTERLQAWQKEAAGMFSLRWFEGGHFFIRQKEDLVLQAIVRELLHPVTGSAAQPAIAMA